MTSSNVFENIGVRLSILTLSGYLSPYTTATYDADGNLTQSRAYFDSGTSDYYATDYQYDWRDRLANAMQLATQLEGDGFEMVAFGQGYASMNWPCKKLEELTLDGKIAHAAHPVLRWMAGNVSIEKDAADNWKPSKKKSIERIDGIVALIMALDRASASPPAESSVYDTRGVLSV